MRFRTNLLTLCFLFLFLQFKAVHLKAQNSSLSFDWGEEYEIPKRNEDLGFIGNAKDGYIQVSHRSHQSLLLQKFSPELKFTTEKEIELSDLPRDYSNEWLTEIGGKYYWFYSTYERSEDKESLFSQELNIVDGSVVGAPVEILTSSKLGGTLEGSIFNMKLKDKWNFYNSFDHSKILVQYRKKPLHRNDAVNYDKLGFFVFDSKMNKIWGREVSMPYTESRMDNEDFQVDHLGNVYTLAKIFDGSSHERNSPNNHFEILKWSADKPAVEKIPFNLNDRFVKSANLSEMPDGKLLVSGYESEHRGGSVEGAFLLKMDETTNKIEKIMKGNYGFPASILTQYENRRIRRRMEKRDKNDDLEADNLELRNVRVNDDNSIEIYGEEHYIVEYETYNASTKTHERHYTFFYKDILAMKIGADGELKWMKKIPKFQKGGNGLASMSFKQYSYKGSSYLLFLDKEDNMDLEVDESPSIYVDGKGGILMAVKIDPQGNVTKTKLYDIKEERVNVTVTDFDDVGNNQLIVRGRARHHESQAALITFK